MTAVAEAERGLVLAGLPAPEGAFALTEGLPAPELGVGDMGEEEMGGSEEDGEDDMDGMDGEGDESEEEGGLDGLGEGEVSMPAGCAALDGCACRE